MRSDYLTWRKFFNRKLLSLIKDIYLIIISTVKKVVENEQIEEIEKNDRGLLGATILMCLGLFCWLVSTIITDVIHPSIDNIITFLDSIGLPLFLGGATFAVSALVLQYTDLQNKITDNRLKNIEKDIKEIKKSQFKGLNIGISYVDNYFFIKFIYKFLPRGEFQIITLNGDNHYSIK